MTTIIIGAGAAGLATAARLRQRGLAYRLIDAGDAVGASWRNRYDSLKLHTVRWLSALPGKPIPKAYGPWVRRDDLVRYLQDYAEELDLRPELGVRATRVDAEDSGWRVETSAGPLTADAVIVASGYSHTPYVPDWPGRDSFAGQVLHSSAYREPSPYAGQRVLVVGSGNSAGDLVTDLAGVAGEVIMAVRTPPNIVRRDTRGVPSQLIGIASDPLPTALKNPMSGLLRKITVPDLSGYGLPAPTKDGFSQFQRSRTVPIIDCGFVDAVTSGSGPDRAGRHRLHRRRGPTGRRESGRGRHRAGGDGLPHRAGAAGRASRGAGRARTCRWSRADDTLPQAPRLHFIAIKVELTGLLREAGIESGQIARSLAGTA